LLPSWRKRRRKEESQESPRLMELMGRLRKKWSKMQRIKRKKRIWMETEAPRIKAKASERRARNSVPNKCWSNRIWRL